MSSDLLSTFDIFLTADRSLKGFCGVFWGYAAWQGCSDGRLREEVLAILRDKFKHLHVGKHVALAEALGDLKTKQKCQGGHTAFCVASQHHLCQQCFHLAKDLRMPARLLWHELCLQQQSCMKSSYGLYRNDCEEHCCWNKMAGNNAVLRHRSVHVKDTWTWFQRVHSWLNPATDSNMLMKCFTVRLICAISSTMFSCRTWIIRHSV